jgi:hypothetical protein
VGSKRYEFGIFPVKFSIANTKNTSQHFELRPFVRRVINLPDKEPLLETLRTIFVSRRLASYNLQRFVLTRSEADAENPSLKIFSKV